MRLWAANGGDMTRSLIGSCDLVKGGGEGNPTAARDSGEGEISRQRGGAEHEHGERNLRKGESTTSIARARAP